MNKKRIIVKYLYISQCNKNIDITIEKELTFLKGGNGSGKTLLFDYLSGIKVEKEASITGNEDNIYICQNVFFYDRLKTKDFVKFVCQLDANGKRVESVVKEISELSESKEIDIKKLLNTQWGFLSGGERKFIYIIVLMSLEREWYFLDEPFVFLDQNKKEIAWKYIEKLRTKKKGIIITSHDEKEKLYSMADKILRI